MSPVFPFIPCSTASMPSSRLQRRRSWMVAAATISSPARQPPVDTGTAQNAIAAPDANTTLTTETAFGRMPACARRRASNLAQVAFRVASTRRALLAESGAVMMGVLVSMSLASVPVTRKHVVEWRLTVRAGRESARSHERQQLWQDVGEAFVELVVAHSHIHAVIVALGECVASE